MKHHCERSRARKDTLACVIILKLEEGSDCHLE